MSKQGLKIRHTGIATDDMEASLKFYRDILGFEVKSDEIESGAYVDQMMGVKEQSFRAVKMVLPDGGMLELLDFEKKGKKSSDMELNDSGLTHFAVQVSDIETLYQTLLDSGYECVNPPATTANKYAKVLFCREPNGRFIELVEVL